MSNTMQYGPWHDVKVLYGPRWTGTAMHYDFEYHVVHPDECGWADLDPDACAFEDVLDDDDQDQSVGDYRARIVKGHYDIVAADDVEDTLEWEPAGGEAP
jgi:hypothetical protein